MKTWMQSAGRNSRGLKTVGLSMCPNSIRVVERAACPSWPGGTDLRIKKMERSLRNAQIRVVVQEILSIWNHHPASHFCGGYALFLDVLIGPFGQEGDVICDPEATPGYANRWKSALRLGCIESAFHNLDSSAS
jgi:hypothetical protein